MHKKVLHGLLIILAVVALHNPGFGQNEKIKGVQIFKTALNTSWANLGDHFVIGIYGESSVFFVLSAISRSRKIGNSLVFVKKLSSSDQILECNMVFVPKTKKSELASIRKMVEEKAILVISEEIDDADSLKCDINLKSEDDKVHFEINKSNLHEDLSISEKLLAEASRVY